MASFMYFTASSIGMTFASLKNAACMIVLVRLPSPSFSASSTALMTKNFASRFASWRLSLAGRCSSSCSSVVHCVLSRNVPPFLSPAATWYWCTYSCLWQAMKLAESMR